MFKRIASRIEGALSFLRLPRIRAGDVYEDCAYHPVLCTEAWREGWWDWNLAGVSLLDGSQPRCCSARYCGVRKMDPREVAFRLKRREAWLAAEQVWRATEDHEAYRDLRKESDQFVQSLSK
jgi:hypothetical protein